MASLGAPSKTKDDRGIILSYQLLRASLPVGEFSNGKDFGLGNSMPSFADEDSMRVYVCVLSRV